MRQSKTVRDFTEAELELAKEGALLHGLSLEQLGFYGAMDLSAISVGQGIGEFGRGVLEQAAENGLTTPELIDFARTEGPTTGTRT
ncbi:hypothetical protein [Arthrobacter sp. N1]|uniref:hypothetical protein n=1 Tax=Arthrobacter sp. N1 TaxID=619291 RepID=UPI003BAF8946